jgi:hypothetical protein
MDNKNKIEVYTAINSAEFDRQISDLQKKIKSLRETGPGGSISQLAQQYRSQGDDQKAQRIEEFRQKQNSRDRMSIAFDLSKQKTQLEALQQTESRISTELKGRLISLEKMNSLLKEQTENKQKILSLTKGIAQAEIALGRGGGGGPQGPAGPGTTSSIGGSGNIQALANIFQKIGGIGSAAAGIGAGMQIYGNFRNFQARLPGMQAVRDVDIARGTGQYAERALRGESFEDIIFAPERARAINKSMDFYQKAQPARETRAKGKAIGGLGLLGLGIAGLAGTVATGGVLPALATIAGFGGGAALLGSEEGYYGLTSNRNALSKMTGKEALEEQEKYRLQEIMKDPKRYYQTKFLGENRRRILGIQRSAGMTDQEMFGKGGFIERGGQQFSFDERAAMPQEIVGAGGGGASAARLNILALQAQRNVGLTNSGQALGRLSNYLNTQESEEAFVKILSKGVSIGLDKSEYREEQKDYIGQVTAIAQKIGGGEQMVASSMAAGLEGDISRRNVQRSAEQFQNAQQMLDQTTGPSGAMKFALMNKDPLMKRLKGLSKLGFQQMKNIDMTEDNPLMQEYYRQATEGMSEEEKKNAGSFKDFVAKSKRMSLESVYLPYAPGKDILKKKDELEKLRNTPFADPAQIKQLESYLLTQEQGLGLSEGQLTKDATSKSRQIGAGGRLDREGKAPKIGEESMLGLDKLGKAEAQAQYSAFGDFGKNVEDIFKQSLENATQSLTNQLIMQEFNRKLNSGAEAVDAFIKALGNQSQSTEKTISKSPESAKPSPSTQGRNIIKQGNKPK